MFDILVKYNPVSRSHQCTPFIDWRMEKLSRDTNGEENDPDDKILDDENLERERLELTNYINKRRRIILMVICTMFAVTSLIMVTSVIYVERNKAIVGYQEIITMFLNTERFIDID